MPQFLPHEAATAGDPNFSNAETFNVDVATTAPNDGETLIFNSTAGIWRPGEAAQGLQRLSQAGGTNSAADGATDGSQSNFHWVAPEGVNNIRVYLTSAGGTGGVGPNPTARPGGGAGGGTAIAELQVVAGQSYDIIIGDDNPGISDAGGSGRGGRTGGATIFRTPSGNTTSLINGKVRVLNVSGGQGGGRNGAGTTSVGGLLTPSSNTSNGNTVSTDITFAVSINNQGGGGGAQGSQAGGANNPAGGGSFYENGGAVIITDGNERGAGGAGFLGFPGSFSSGGAGGGGRGGIFIEYLGPASTIETGLTS